MRTTTIRPPRVTRGFDIRPGVAPPGPGPGTPVAPPPGVGIGTGIGVIAIDTSAKTDGVWSAQQRVLPQLTTPSSTGAAGVPV